jgi:DNA (cytosine-5)-methyltransferase 1
MKVIDLFAGIGGLSLGFQNAGFEIVAAIDNWQAAMEIYQANFSHDTHLMDLSQISDYQKFKDYHPDLIMGGPPCQDFSSAGKRDESRGRADLTLSFANIIAQVKPTWFVMENVERITKSVTLQKALKIFKAAEYGLSYQILDASRCGVPQLRKRFFLVGLLAAPDSFLDDYLNQYLTEKPMSIFDYLGHEGTGVVLWDNPYKSYQKY